MVSQQHAAAFSCSPARVHIRHPSVWCLFWSCAPSSRLYVLGELACAEQHTNYNVGACCAEHRLLVPAAEHCVRPATLCCNLLTAAKAFAGPGADPLAAGTCSAEAGNAAVLSCRQQLNCFAVSTDGFHAPAVESCRYRLQCCDASCQQQLKFCADQQPSLLQSPLQQCWQCCTARMVLC